MLLKASLCFLHVQFVITFIICFSMLKKFPQTRISDEGRSGVEKSKKQGGGKKGLNGRLGWINRLPVPKSNQIFSDSQSVFLKFFPQTEFLILNFRSTCIHLHSSFVLARVTLNKTMFSLFLNSFRSVFM